MKKFLAIILAGLMLLSLAACGGKDDTVKLGALEMEGEGLFVSEEHEAHRKEEDGVSSDARYERVNYSNLSAALMDLESGKIIELSVTDSVANYIAAHNEKIVVSKKNDAMTNFSMMTLDTNKEVYDILNNAIKEMKADGTLDTLIENELKAYINSDPEAKDLPKFDGAKTVKIGVTGDLPPMDFVAANGKAAGFNIALLTEIANRAQVNIELVQIDSAARATALSTEKVDAVFWAKSVSCDSCGNAVFAEEIEGTLVTETYFCAAAAILMPKSDK